MSVLVAIVLNELKMQTALIRSHKTTNQLTHPYQSCMDNALVHYTLYSPGRGGLTITCMVSIRYFMGLG